MGMLPPVRPESPVKARARAVSLALATLALSPLLLSPTAALASLELARNRNCVACHAVDKTLIGPSFKDIAARYGRDRDAVARLARKVREGGVGVWGNKVTPMPANPQVSEEEATTLVRWILEQR